MVLWVVDFQEMKPRVKSPSLLFKNNGTLRKPRATAQQKIFAKVVAETGDLVKAKLLAYGGGTTTVAEDAAEARNLVASPAARKEILRIWAEKGLTLEMATARHMEILKDKRQKGGITLKAAEMVYEAWGAFDKSRGMMGEGSGASMINIFIEQRKARGLEIPAGIIEAEEVV